MIFGLTFQNLHAFIYRAPPLFLPSEAQKDEKKYGFAISGCQKFIYLQKKSTKKKNMETITTWAKENFQLIVLAVSVAGVLLAIISLILEVRKKKEKENQ